MFTVDVCDHEKQYTIYWLISGNWREIAARESDIYARQKSKTLPSKKKSHHSLCCVPWILIFSDSFLTVILIVNPADRNHNWVEKIPCNLYEYNIHIYTQICNNNKNKYR